MMQRLPLFHLLFLIVCFGIFGCHSTHSYKKVTVTSHSFYEDCPKIQYNPIQVVALNNDLSRSFGSGFYIKNLAGKHIVITNAHVVHMEGDTYHKRVKIYDQNGDYVRAKVIAIRDHKFFKKLKGTSYYTTHKMADIAILEISKMSPAFDYTPLTLSTQKGIGIVYSKGIDLYDNVWQGCFGIAYEGKGSYLYSDNTTAQHSFSGTPVINKNGEVLGIITLKGNVVVNNHELPLFIKNLNEGKIIITSHPTFKFKLFAIITPSEEIRILLNEFYKNNNFKQ